MDTFILKLDAAERCENYARNVEKTSPENAMAARRRAVELLAAKYGAQTIVENEALQAVYAFERTLFVKHGKVVKANRTWQMIKKKGIIPAVDHIVKQPKETDAFAALVSLGLRDKAFEAVVLRHQEVFSAEAIARSNERLPNYIGI